MTSTELESALPSARPQAATRPGFSFDKIWRWLPIRTLSEHLAELAQRDVDLRSAGTEQQCQLALVETELERNAPTGRNQFCTPSSLLSSTRAGWRRVSRPVCLPCANR